MPKIVIGIEVWKTCFEIIFKSAPFSNFAIVLLVPMLMGISLSMKEKVEKKPFLMSWSMQVSSSVVGGVHGREDSRVYAQSEV